MFLLPEPSYFRPWSAASPPANPYLSSKAYSHAWNTLNHPGPPVRQKQRLCGTHSQHAGCAFWFGLWEKLLMSSAQSWYLRTQMSCSINTQWSIREGSDKSPAFPWPPSVTDMCFGSHHAVARFGLLTLSDDRAYLGQGSWFLYWKGLGTVSSSCSLKFFQAF